MKRQCAIATGLLFVALAAAPFAQQAFGQAGWVTLFDGKSLDNWNQIGDANWKLADGVVTPTRAAASCLKELIRRLCSCGPNSGPMRTPTAASSFAAPTPTRVGTDSAYEVNIYDKRPEPDYGTGAIVNIAKVAPMPKAGGKWNVYEITAKGPELTCRPQRPKDRRRASSDSKFANGRIALQYGAGVVKDKGVVKFRKVEIKSP